MKLRDIYLKAYCDGDKLSDKEVLEAMEAFDKAAQSLVVLGPAFHVTFKELTRTYLWLHSVAHARGILNNA